MKRTARLLTGCLSLAGTVWTQSAWANPPLLNQVAIGQALLGQTAAEDPTAKRREADDLVRRARQCMKDGDLEQAHELVSKAEQLGVVYSGITARFGDTPDKARKDLDAMRGKSGKVAKPSDRFKPAAISDRDPRTTGSATSGTPAKTPGAVVDAAEKLASEAQSNVAAGFDRAARSGFAQNPGPTPNSPLERLPSLDRVPAVGGSFVPPDSLADTAKAIVQDAAAEVTQEAAAAASDVIEKAADVADAAEEKLAAVVDAAESSVEEVPANVAANLDAATLTLKKNCLRMVAQAQAAMDRGDMVTAQRLITQAKNMQVPDEAFEAGETHPSIVGLQIERALNRRGNAVVAPVKDGAASAAAVGPAPVVPASKPRTAPANSAAPNNSAAPGKVAPAGGVSSTNDRYPVARGVYEPSKDKTKTVKVQAEQELPSVLGTTPTGNSQGEQLYAEGLKALEKQDREQAVKLFRDAWRFADQMPPETRAALKDKLSLMQDTPSVPSRGVDSSSALEAIDAKQQVLRQQLYREITAEQDAAKRMIATEPKQALQRLQRLRDRVAESDLDPPSRKQLMSIVDRNLGELERFIETNRSDIDNTERNQLVNEKVERERRMKNEVQNKVAELVEEFNKLMDEGRFHEAEVRAKQARELDPDNPVVETLKWKSKFAIRIAEQNAIKDGKEQGFYDAMTSVDRASTPYNDDEPITFNKKYWNELNQGNRKKWMERQKRRMTPAEQEIQRSLAKPVEARFDQRPLKEVIETLAAASGINIHLDNAGLAAEGVTTDTPVSLNLAQPIALRSALNIILGELRLSYVIRNEVLSITSEQTRDADTYPQVYDVADLVIPIPNFTPGYHTGLPAAIMEAHRAIGHGGLSSPSGSSQLTLAANQTNGANNSSVLAQMGAGALQQAGIRPPTQLGSGPGGLGGGAQPDFDNLIELITTTIAPTQWSEVGGGSTIEPFPTNLSIVVSTTQEVHDQIADLLEQLRRLQDLQVTIEVRFITLRDNFFERMGVSFDFRVDDNTGLNSGNGAYPDDNGPSYVIGLNNANGTAVPTADLDLPFTQGSFASTVPQFGGFDANTAANFGFAILSDIEVFLLLQAGAGDQRSNVLQAPKVTLFNGQQASVADTSQKPFVTSLVPVVGDFAAAQQPIIVVLNEGTSLSVQAVVSADRRFVRLTLVPFFSKIGDVQEFTFSGSKTTKSGTNIKDPTDDNKTIQDGVETTTTGTTVQLPTFAFTTVTTTVSVPDGGTVLLGGIKRLAEARSERGVPMLNKIPYVNRLFKNVGIGRETTSLMLMVTPRIIIQEEEEAKLGIDLGQ